MVTENQLKNLEHIIKHNGQCVSCEGCLLTKEKLRYYKNLKEW